LAQERGAKRGRVWPLDIFSQGERQHGEGGGGDWEARLSTRGEKGVGGKRQGTEEAFVESACDSKREGTTPYLGGAGEKGEAGRLSLVCMIVSRDRRKKREEGQATSLGGGRNKKKTKKTS